MDEVADAVRVWARVQVHRLPLDSIYCYRSRLLKSIHFRTSYFGTRREIYSSQEPYFLIEQIAEQKPMLKKRKTLQHQAMKEPS